MEPPTDETDASDGSEGLPGHKVLNAAADARAIAPSPRTPG